MSVPTATIPLNADANLSLAADQMATQVTDVVRSAGSAISKAIYVTCYGTSYGVTFPVVFLIHVIPGGRPLATGFVDGARAARDYVRAVKVSHHHQHRHETVYDEPGDN